jgi:hypothetical protein
MTSTIHWRKTRIEGKKEGEAGEEEEQEEEGGEEEREVEEGESG